MLRIELVRDTITNSKSIIIKAMTEKVVYVEHPERTVLGGSGLCDYYMKTIPKLCVEGNIHVLCSVVCF